MTAVDTTAFSTQDYNLYVRDNMRMMAPEVATAAEQYCVTAGFREIAMRSIADAFISTSQTTTSTTYTNLTTVGPQVTVDTGVSALVFFAVAMSNNTLNSQCSASVEVSGSSNVKANNHWRIIHDGKAAGNVTRTMGIHRFAAELKEGSNTFTVKYKVASNTGTFSRRYLAVMPL
jgi:hypothetical protein